MIENVFIQCMDDGHFENVALFSAWMGFEFRGREVTRMTADEIEGRTPRPEDLVFGGVEVVRPFGDLWVVGEGKGTTPDGTAMDWVISLGFDPQRPMGETDPAGRFIGTFLASVMPGMFVYEGTKAGDVLTLDTEGPSMGDPSMLTAYRDVIEMMGDDLRVMTSHSQMADGSWFGFMKGEYRRVP